MVKASLERILVIDWETTGIRDQRSPAVSYVEGVQGIEFGAVVANYSDLTEIDAFSTRLRFLGSHDDIEYGQYPELTWGVNAEKIHGITLDQLNTAPSHAEAGEAFLDFLSRNFSPRNPILIAAHNPTGDRYYTMQFLFLAGIIDRVRFHHRMLDSFTVGYTVFGTESSDALFLLTSNTQRAHHTAIGDARLCLTALRESILRLRTSGFGSPDAMDKSVRSGFTVEG